MGGAYTICGSLSLTNSLLAIARGCLRYIAHAPCGNTWDREFHGINGFPILVDRLRSTKAVKSSASLLSDALCEFLNLFHDTRRKRLTTPQVVQPVCL